MPITLRQLRYFQALVEQGSFSRAAESVFVSQPALSLQIRELEASLGGPLVERESRGIHLTRLGREAHEQTLRILDETNFLELMGKQFDEGRARVTLGIVSTLSPYLLPGLLQRLQDSSPGIEPTVVEATGNELVSDLAAGRLDAAILSMPLGMIEFPERELFEDRFLVAGRAGPVDAVRSHSGTPRPEDLARADVGPLLTLADGHCLADQVLGACSMWRQQDVHRGAGSLATLSRLVAGGEGIALIPETAVACEGAMSPDLSFMRFAPPEPLRRIGLVHRLATHGQRWIDPLAEAVSDAGHELTRRAQETLGEQPAAA
ncbi:MAG: LysR family transcriptional regulator [Alphaproteobacteria bacterium]|nr:LysR family transcriptional regulator [Alphaproteobacteria bacterium]